MLVIPDKMSREKIFHLKAMGAEVVMTRSDVGKGHPDYYQDIAERIAAETGAFYVNQFGNPANPTAHETTTGPEIWEQMGHRARCRRLRRRQRRHARGPHAFLPRGRAATSRWCSPIPRARSSWTSSRPASTATAGSWLVEGIGEDFVPPIADLSGVQEAYSITDAESFATARELLAKEGILGGSSTGTLLAAALRYCRSRTQPERVVTFVCDSGNKYLSKMFNDYWLADQGFRERRPLRRPARLSSAAASRNAPR